jgi:hypothetical protein
VYSIVPDTAVMAQVAALPIAALDAYADVLDVLQLTPWNGEPQHKDNRGRRRTTLDVRPRRWPARSST